MFSPIRECHRCGGRGFRPIFGPLFIECRTCDGTGQEIKLTVRIWHRIRFGSGEE